MNTSLELGPKSSRYVEELQTQLAHYQRDEFTVLEDGLWIRNGRPYAPETQQDRPALP